MFLLLFQFFNNLREIKNNRPSSRIVQPGLLILSSKMLRSLFQDVGSHIIFN